VSPLDDFLVRAAVAAVLVAVAAGPLGCFVVWRRMAFFGDATAHATLLGVALALATGLPLFLGVLVAALAMALFIATAAGRAFAADTLLSVAAHGALAFGMLAAAFTPALRVDLEAYLFGDILAVSRADLGLIAAGSAAVIGLLVWRWSRLLLATLNADLAAAEGGDPRREQLVLMIALALLVAVALKAVGALLVTALLIVPAAAARAVARDPETMALGAAGAGAAAALGGLGGSWRWDVPTGPAIVAAAVGLLALSALAGPLRRAAAQNR
jgi:zinc transport system permease protein